MLQSAQALAIALELGLSSPTSRDAFPLGGPFALDHPRPPSVTTNDHPKDTPETSSARLAKPTPCRSALMVLGGTRTFATDPPEGIASEAPPPGGSERMKEEVKVDPGGVGLAAPREVRVLPSRSSARLRAAAPPGGIDTPMRAPFFQTFPAESPILLPGSQAEPSPTTGTFPGTFPLPPFFNGGGPNALASSSPLRPPDPEKGHSGFPFKPYKPHPFPLSNLSKGPPAPVTVPDIPRPPEPPRPALTTTASPPSTGGGGHATIQEEGVERLSEDGYNWRKYGQKQVKGSGFPRSYYKCTHPGCPVKKKVERAGGVIENVYKGTHTHPQPAPTRRPLLVAQSMAEVALVTGRHWKGGGEDTGGLSRELSLDGGIPSVATELSLEPPSPTSARRGGLNGSPVASPPCSPRVGSGEKRKGGGGEEDEEAKRKKVGVVIEGVRTGREPRVVMEATSDVDVLEDGFRWRKYGQKSVKGSPFPRHYYKCTTAGCPVRKQIERSATNHKIVVTTYEGQHDHDPPAATPQWTSDQEKSHAPPPLPSPKPPTPPLEEVTSPSSWSPSVSPFSNMGDGSMRQFLEEAMKEEPGKELAGLAPTTRQFMLAADLVHRFEQAEAGGGGGG